MTTPDRNTLTEHLRQLGLLDASDWQATAIAGDGSDRRFFRLSHPKNGTCLAVIPAATSTAELAEANAARLIGVHLRKRGISVPEILGFDEASGIIIFEDLGNTLLHDRINALRQSDGPALPKLRQLYRDIIDDLLYMQISGSVRFDRRWCWQTQRYDRKVMLEKESGYFQEAFCRRYLGIDKFAAGLAAEFKKLAGTAGKQPAVYFMHRDFQSRNLMIKDGEIRIIDFQAGRLGPLGYDLASLLIDPYASLPETLQDELLEYYVDQHCQYGLDDQAFLKGYNALALQRNLQILGAFAFLDRQKNKPFFRQFIAPALDSLRKLLAKPAAADYPLLRTLATECQEILTSR